MKEKQVVQVVKAHFENQGYLVLEQFVVTNGKIDVAAFKWADQFDIDCVGVECKSEAYVGSVYDILRQQISDYQKSFPKVCLATLKPSEENLRTFIDLCEIQKAGYISVDQAGSVKLVHPPEMNRSLDADLYIADVRSWAALFLTFKDLFGELQTKTGWCSTKGKNLRIPPSRRVQFNAWRMPDTGDIMFGINIEDARRIISDMSSSDFLDAFKKVPREALLKVSREEYFGKGLRVGRMLVQKEISGLASRDTDYITRSARTGTNLHLQVSMKLWRYDDVLSRDEHSEKMTNAKGAMHELYDFMKSREH